MNKKRVSLPLICSLLLLSGCSLAREEASEGQPDRLVGVYLTAETPNAAGNDPNWVEYGSITADTEYGQLQLPKRILPARFDEATKEFTFPGLKGYALFAATIPDAEVPYTVTVSDLSDGDFHVTYTDYGDSYEMKGTLYVGEARKDTIWTANKVYQTPDGVIYLDGTGNSYQGSDFSSKVKETHTVTTDGEEHPLSTTAEFSIQTVQELKGLLVHQYDAAGQRVDTRELPLTVEDQDVVWAPGAAWAVVEERYADHVQHTAYDHGPEDAEPPCHTLTLLDRDNMGVPCQLHFSNP